jgi:uncharacterized peroxidase-related enzyme
VAHIALPDGIPGMRALLAFRPEIGPPLGALTDILLHAPNTLTPAERELIGAHVSNLNDCTFCRESHKAIAACHLDGDQALVDAVIDAPEQAPVTDKLKALLALAGRVQLGGRAVRTEDVARARAAGATDLEIHDTVLIAAAFCLFNRYVDGLGALTPSDPDAYRQRARLTARDGYAAGLPAGPAAPARAGA